MPRRIIFPNDDRSLVRDVLDRLALSQSDLAEMASGVEKVSRSWLSSALKITESEEENDGEVGSRVDGDILKVVVGVLADRVLGGKEYGPDEQRNVLSRLSRYNPAILKKLPSTSTRPGDVVRADASNYVERPESAALLGILTGLPASALVTGPPQVGVSTLLAHLANRSHEIGIETVLFDPVSAGATSRLPGKSQPERVSRFVDAMYETLQLEWELPAASDGIDSIPQLVSWLQKSLRLTAQIPRVIVMDNMSKFGADAVEDITSLFVRAIHNKRATNGAQIFLIMGLTYQYGASFQRHLLELSSIVAWQPRIDLGWFTLEQVEHLQIGLGKAPDDDVFLWLKGQPYLTNAAILDAEFKGAIEQWMELKDDESAKVVKNSKPYKAHLASIRSCIIGTHRSFSEKERKVIRGWASMSDGHLVRDNEVEAFLERSRLAVAGQSTIDLYDLMADDLAGELEE